MPPAHWSRPLFHTRFLTKCRNHLRAAAISPQVRSVSGLIGCEVRECAILDSDSHVYYCMGRRFFEGVCTPDASRYRSTNHSGD
jgi:hypothetical protein